MSANVPATGIGPVPESVPQISWGSWLVQIARSLNLLRGTVNTSGIANLKGFASSPPLTLYVRSTGDDGNKNNNGLSASTAFKTIGHAVAVAQLYHCNGQNIVIDIGAGTWNESVAVAGPLFGSGASGLNSGQILLSGAGAGSTTLAGVNGNSYTICAGFAGVVGVQNMTISAAGAGQSALFAQLGGVINVYTGITFAGANAQIAHAENAGSQIQFWNSCTISAGAGYFIFSGSGATVELNPATATITLTGTPAFSTGFVGAAYGGNVYLGAGWSFSGSATGARHYVDQNGVVYNGTGSTLPGSLRGKTGRGGSYAPASLPTINAETGLGTGGGATTETGAGSRCGTILLNTGTAATAATGTVQITFNNELLGFTDALPIPVFLSLITGPSQSWAAGASAVISGYGSDTVTITWSNNGGALALNATYRLCYLCETPS